MRKREDAFGDLPPALIKLDENRPQRVEGVGNRRLAWGILHIFIRLAFPELRFLVLLRVIAERRSGVPDFRRSLETPLGVAEQLFDQFPR